MFKPKLFRSNSGFTLIEIVAVLVILGILAAIVVPRFVYLENQAKQKSLDTIRIEMNGREILTWANHKLSTSGFVTVTALDSYQSL